jgi:uncharacterized protein (DUF305 family)
MADGLDEDQREAAPASRWSRVAVVAGAVVAVLLIGATLGMLLTNATNDDPARRAAAPGAGSVEVGFAQDMSVHHLQAVTMANWARGNSTDPAVRQLAFDIGSTQLEQVGRMKGWLMLWNQPEQPLGGYMEWMTGPGGHGGHGGHGAMQTSGQTSNGAPMPGMATNEELERLRSLSGEELDIYFLQLMLRHHQGGTEMAQYARDHSSLPAVDQLTRSMLVSQGAEMRTMRQMLAERGAEPLPFP